MKMLRALIGQKALEKAAHQTTWKTVWSAGQGVGLIDDILPSQKIVERLVEEYWEAYDAL
jgi:nitronate monooxygenase